jgi:tetratricopeptide (TPR) repeat protein
MVSILIRADEAMFQSGIIKYAGNYLDEIQTLFPELSSLKFESIRSAIGIYSRKNDKARFAQKINVISFTSTPSEVKITFSVVGELPISSENIYKRVWGKLRQSGVIETGSRLPFCCLLTDEEMTEIIQPKSVAVLTQEEEMKQLKEKNNWMGIYEKFAPIEKLRDRPEWNQPQILSEISFACGKLAQVSLGEIPKNNPEKDRVLNIKNKYRQETYLLRQRCLELKPTDPTYIANLAYFHYQNAQELKGRARKDGNLRAEADSAIETYEKNLSINPNRIKDYYRIGYLLIEVIPGTCWRDQNWELAKKKRAQGIQALQKAMELWELLDPNDPIQKKEKSRCRNEYIKSFYVMGCAYYDRIGNNRKWEPAVFALKLNDVGNLSNGNYYPPDLENAQKAWQCFYKCWELDRTNSLETTTNGVCEGVDKLYSLGKTAFLLYWIESSYGLFNDSPKAIEHRDNAEKYLSDALKFPWSANKKNQSKDFVEERLARVYITKKDYQKAVDILNKNPRRRLMAYQINTLALALILLEQYDDAQEKLQNAIKDRHNLDMKKSQFLRACSLYGQKNFREAQQAFLEITEMQETVMSLVGQAFVAYRLNKKEDAISYLKKANEKDPYNVAVAQLLVKVSGGSEQPVKSNLSKRAETDEDYTLENYDVFEYAPSEYGDEF